MAKSKPKKDHDDDLPEEVEEVKLDETGADEVEVADVEDVADADMEAVDADVEEVEDADIEDVEADADDIESVKADDDGDDGDEPEDSVDEGPKPPRPRLTKWQIALIALNWVAIPAFTAAAWLDYSIRNEYAYRTIANYVQMIGIPLREEEEFPGFANETRHRVRLSREQIVEAYKKRSGVNKAVKDFASVDEPIPFWLRPSDMDETMKAAVFRDLPNPVATQEDEIDRLKLDLPKRIADAADEVLKKQTTDDEKKAIVRKTLYPIVGDARWKAKDAPLNIWEIDKINDKLEKLTGAELDEMVKDSVQRRIYWDILAPLNLVRPGDVTAAQIETMGDLNVTIDDLKGYLLARLDAAIAPTYDPKVYIGAAFGKNVKRDTAEKRRAIAQILFTLGQVEKPGLNEKLIKKGIERAQTISGLSEFTNATIEFVGAVQVLENRLAQAIHDDRVGAVIKSDKAPTTRTEGFIDLYEAEIDRLVRLYGNLETAQKRLADLTKRQGEVQSTRDQRKKHFDKTLEKLKEERAKTANYMAELRKLQSELHQALVELSDAADTNLRILDEITNIESDYIRKNTPKGGKK